MKRIAAVRVAFRRYGTYRVPYSDTAYASRIVADEGEGLEAELDAATNAVAGVTWNLERGLRRWEGAIAGADPALVESVRRHLLAQNGWKPLDEENGQPPDITDPREPR
jgi:hypothetical protein